MDENTRENMIKIGFYVPPAMYEIFKKLADSEGISESELHRAIWLDGLSYRAERHNKLEVLQKMWINRGY